jgi:DNA-binding GntR family transcriptional regulator
MKKVNHKSGLFDMEKLSANSHLSRVEFVYQAIKDAFANHRFRSGDRIREDEIAAELGVSRTPVREALSRLLTRGLIEVTDGRGLFVTRLDTQQIIEIYAMREVLDATASSLAAQHASKIQIGQLRDLIGQFAASESDLIRLGQINRLFHQIINEACCNRYLIQSLNAFQETTALLPPTNYSSKERVRSAHSEHIQIVDAIEAHNIEKAERAGRLHMRNALAQRIRMIFHERCKMDPL